MKGRGTMGTLVELIFQLGVYIETHPQVVAYFVVGFFFGKFFIK